MQTARLRLGRRMQEVCRHDDAAVTIQVRACVTHRSVNGGTLLPWLKVQVPALWGRGSLCRAEPQQGMHVL